eukprot:GEMP01011404.1.p1 GENE.GEMP01011404.1~~GEMP01011404.1.p1  ORF type:complete len:702 (+),score=203.59 GEMP01011404.1:418-2523(+)
MASGDDAEGEDTQLESGVAHDKYFRKMSCFRLLRELRERLTELKLLPTHTGASHEDDLRSLFFQLFDDMTVDCAYFVHALETSDAWPKNWNWSDKVSVFYALSEGHAEITAQQWRESILNLLALRRTEGSAKVTTTLDAVVKDLARCCTYRQKTLRHLDFTRSGLVSAYELQLLPVRMYPQTHIKAAILKILMSYCDTHNVALVQCVSRRPGHLASGFTASEGPWLLSCVIDASVSSNTDSMEAMVKTPAYCSALAAPQSHADEESFKELPKPLTIGLKKSAPGAKGDRLSSSTTSTRASSTYHVSSPGFGTADRGLEPPVKQPPALRSADRLTRSPLSSPAIRAPRPTTLSNLERITLPHGAQSLQQRKFSGTGDALSPQQRRTMHHVAALPLRRLSDTAPVREVPSVATDRVVADRASRSDVHSATSATGENAHRNGRELVVVAHRSSPSRVVEIREVRKGQGWSFSSDDKVVMPSMPAGAEEDSEANVRENAEHKLRAYKEGVQEQSERDAMESLRAYRSRVQSSIGGEDSLSLHSADEDTEASMLHQVTGDVIQEQYDNERDENLVDHDGDNLRAYRDSARQMAWGAHDNGLQPEVVRPAASMRDEALRHYMISQQSNAEFQATEDESPRRESLEDVRTTGRDTTEHANVHANAGFHGRDWPQNWQEDDEEASHGVEDEAYWMRSLQMAKMVRLQRA